MPTPPQQRQDSLAADVPPSPIVLQLVAIIYHCPDSPSVRATPPAPTPRGMPIGAKRARSEAGHDADEVVTAAAFSREEPRDVTASHPPQAVDVDGSF